MLDFILEKLMPRWLISVSGWVADATYPTAVRVADWYVDHLEEIRHFLKVTGCLIAMAASLLGVGYIEGLDLNSR